MSNITTIPNEVLDEITRHLGPSATSHLLITCRSLSSRLAHDMFRHAIAPKDSLHALHWAAEKGHLPLVQFLITRFPVDIHDENHRTALQLAAGSRNNVLVLEHLLLNGAEINHADDDGLTALHYACQGNGGSEEISEATVRLLITYGADVDREVPFVPLRFAICASSTNIMRILLKAGANPNPSVLNGTIEPLIVTAARGGRAPKMLELLLDYGADINASSSHRTNPLLIAAEYGNLKLVEFLVKRGANLDCADNDGDTPLILAIGQGRQAVAEYLVGLEGIDILSTNIRGRGPVTLAAQLGYDAVLRRLLRRGAPVETMDIIGRTAFQVAEAFGKHGIMRTLLEHGAKGCLPDL